MIYAVLIPFNFTSVFNCIGAPDLSHETYDKSRIIIQLYLTRLEVIFKYNIILEKEMTKTVPRHGPGFWDLYFN